MTKTVPYHQALESNKLRKSVIYNSKDVEKLTRKDKERSVSEITLDHRQIISFDELLYTL